MEYSLIEETAEQQPLSLIPPEEEKQTQQTSLLDKKADFNILEKLKFLRDNKRFCDVVLEVRGVKFVAHKNVLASWSPTFAAKLFTDDPKVFNDYITVYYDNSEVFSDLLDFMYNGYVAPRETNFLQLLHLAVSFQIETLKNYCEEFLRCNLHLGNFVSTYFLSRKFKLETLEEFIVGFLQLNLSDAVKQGEFLSLRAEKFNTLLSEGWMKKIKPEIKLFLIISWVGYDTMEREKYLVLLLGHINWSTVANDFLLEINRTENFFTSHESSLYLLLQTLFSAGIPLGPYKEAFPKLRQRHSAILAEVVHTSLLKMDTEEFCPVTISIHARPGFRSSADNTKLTMLPCNMADIAINTDVNSLHFEESEKTIAAGTSETMLVEAPAEVPDTRYEQFETLGEFIEAEIHKFKEQENQRLHKDNEATNYEYNQQGTSVDQPPHPYDLQQSIQETPQTVCADNVAQTSSGKKQASSEKRSVDKTSHFSPQRQSKRSVKPRTKLKFSECFDEAEEMDEEVKDKNFKPNDKHAESNEDEDSEPDSAERNSKIVKQIKSGFNGKSRGRKKKVAKSPSDQELAKPMMCKVEGCAYITKFPDRMEKHVKYSHESSFELRCNLCQFETKEVRKYHTHMKQHFAGPPYKCDYPRCTFTAEKIQAMLVHRSTHTDDRQFTCECGMRFRTNNTLIAHRKVHTGEKKVDCPECGVSFMTRSTLNQHMVIHSDVRPYLCDLCGFSTKFQSHLTAHKRLHTGEVFNCQFPKCSYFTPKRSQLKAHMRAHLGIRAHICEVCSKTFVEKSHLMRHLRIHNSERISCDQCEYTTTRKDKLKEHIKKHHSDEAQMKPKKVKPPPTTKTKGGVKKTGKSPNKVVNDSEGTGEVVATPMLVKWDHGGYSLSQEHENVTHGDDILTTEGDYSVLRETLTSAEPMHHMLALDHLSAQISGAKTLDSTSINNQDANILAESGAVNAHLAQSASVPSLNATAPVLSLLNSPLGSVDQPSVLTSKIDTPANGQPSYAAIQTTSADNNPQPEYTGLNAFMAFIQ